MTGKATECKDRTWQGVGSHADEPQPRSNNHVSVDVPNRYLNSTYEPIALADWYYLPPTEVSGALDALAFASNSGTLLEEESIGDRESHFDQEECEEFVRLANGSARSSLAH